VPPPAASPPPPAAPPPAATAPPAPPAPVACTYGPTRRLTQIQNRDLKEASALVASRRWPGVYWSLNDSGNDADIFAVDEQGASRGTFHVDNARNVDWETMQLGPDGAGSFALYVGDVGDNDEDRKESTIYRFAEPEPLPVGTRNQEATTARAEAFRIAFPNGPRNTEAMLVHPTTGEITFVTKDEGGHSEIYRLPTPADPRRVTTLELVGQLNLNGLRLGSKLVTDGSVSPDARYVLVRTYSSGLEFDLPDGAALSSIWNQSPRIFQIDDGGHGEGATYRTDGQSIVSTAEAEPASLYVTPRHC
jgi:hypothetical protein